MKKFLALAVTAIMLVHIGPVLAGTQPIGGSNNGGTALAAATAPVAPSTESAGIVGAAAFAAAALVYAGVAVAQHHSHPSALSSGPRAMADRALAGRIVSVNAGANTIIVRTKQGETGLYVAPDAKIKVGKESRLADLKVGSKIKVACKMEGAQKVVSRIW